MSLEFENTSLPGVILFKPTSYGDNRGFFQEIYRANSYQEAGLTRPFVQDNHSRSSQGILRGMHYQLPSLQGKLVYVPRGRVFDVAVDIRVGSPTFGQWYGTILDDQNHYQLWVPEGFAHGFYVMSETVDFIYKCTEYYQPTEDAGFLWNDPDIGIAWPLTGPAKTSGKDALAPCLKDISKDHLPKYQG